MIIQLRGEETDIFICRIWVSVKQEHWFCPNSLQITTKAKFCRWQISWSIYTVVRFWCLEKKEKKLPKFFSVSVCSQLQDHFNQLDQIDDRPHQKHNAELSCGRVAQLLGWSWGELSCVHGNTYTQGLNVHKVEIYFNTDLVLFLDDSLRVCSCASQSFK